MAKIKMKQPPEKLAYEIAVFGPQQKDVGLAQILQEELTAIQDLLKPGDMLIIEPKDIRLSTLFSVVAIGSQAVAAILEERYAAQD